MVDIPTDRRSSRRLAQAVAASDKRWRDYRMSRQLYIRRYAGPYYGHQWLDTPDILRDARPLNTIFSAVTILVSHLQINFPGSRIETDQVDLEPVARVLSAHQTTLYRRMNLGKTMEGVILDAMFAAGITKTSLPAESQLPHDWKIYQPYIDRVDLDDYILDAACRNRDEAAFEGNRYRVRRDEALESGLFKGHEDLIKGLPQVGSRNQDKASNLTDDGAVLQAAEFDDLIELADIYFPRTQTLATIPGHQDSSGDILLEREWQGHDEGPYDMLGFYWAPDNPMPIPIVSTIVDLDQAINDLSTKAIARAKAAKSFVLTDQRDPELAHTIRDIRDGQIGSVPDSSRAQEMNIGGKDLELNSSINYLSGWQSRLAGNTDLLGGLDTASDTATQDQMLYGSAGMRIGNMRAKVQSHYASLARKIAWYTFNEPSLQEPVTIEIPGGIRIQAELTADMLDADFAEYSFKVSTYANAPETPQEEYQSLADFLQTIVMPLLPVAAQQGSDIDASEIMQRAARARGIEGFGNMIRPTMPHEMQQIEQQSRTGENTTVNISPPQPDQQESPDA